MYLFVCRIITLIVFVIVVLLANIIIVAMFAVIVGAVVVVVNPKRIQLKSQSVSFAYTFSHNNSSNSK